MLGGRKSPWQRPREWMNSRLNELEAEVLDQGAALAAYAEHIIGGDGREREDEGEVAAVGAVDPEVIEGDGDVEIVFNG